MATVATAAAAAAARHNAALLVPKVGFFFFGFFSSETLELGSLERGGEKWGKRFLQEMNFFS